MAQRRNSSGRADDRSDLDDVKALAAKARETGGPVLKPNASELSGVRARRDSVIGMRVTPPPRATSGELPNWFWGVLGCLSVLLVGFAGIFVLGRAGKLGPLMATAMVAPAASPAPAPAPPPEPAPAAKAPEPSEPPAPSEAQVAERVAHAERVAREHAERVAHEHVAAAAPAEATAPSAPVAADEPPADNAAAPAPDDSAAKHPARVPAAAAKPHAPADDSPAAAAAPDDNAGDQPAEAKVPLRPSHAAPAAPKTADDSDDDQSLPGQDDVERALDALASRVRGCFVKYQIKGTARVRLVATPAGKAESVNVTGDFEDTPTGLCVESVINDAKLPTFKGPPLKLSQSYQLR